MNLKKHLKCEIIDDVNGDIMCGCGCGYVLKQKISTQKQQDSISTDPQQRLLQTHHKKISNKYHDGGLGTAINPHDKIFNSSENNKTRSQFHRFARLQKISRMSKNPDRRISQLLQATSDIVARNKLPEMIMDRCVDYINEGEKLQILKGKKRLMTSMTLIYLACRELSCFYNPKNDLKELKLKRFFFARNVLHLKESLNVKYDSINTRLAILGKHQNELRLKPRIIKQVEIILQYCNSKQLSISKMDKIWVAQAVWLAWINDKDYKFSKFPRVNDIANIFDTTDASMKTLQKLLNDAGVLEILKLKSTLTKNISNMRSGINV